MRRDTAMQIAAENSDVITETTVSFRRWRWKRFVNRFVFPPTIFPYTTDSRRYPGKIDRRGRDSRMTRALHASIVTWTECECVSFFFFAEESTRIFIHPRKTRLFGTRGKYSWGERVGIEIDTVGNCWIILHECSWCRVGGGGRKGRGREKEV